MYIYIYIYIYILCIWSACAHLCSCTFLGLISCSGFFVKEMLLHWRVPVVKCSVASKRMGTHRNGYCHSHNNWGPLSWFQRFSSSKLVLKTVKSSFVALNYYENSSMNSEHLESLFFFWFVYTERMILATPSKMCLQKICCFCIACDAHSWDICVLIFWYGK